MPQQESISLTPAVLIVEDEGIVAMDIRQRLESMGFKVTATVATGADALAQISETKPDLILMDIQILGNMDGIETAAKVNEKYDIPVVYLTANSDQATIDRAKSTGPLAYLLKPFEDRELKTTIEITLYRFRLEQKLKKNEQWLSTLLDSMGDAIIATDDTGHILLINPIAESLTGWNSEDAKGEKAENIFNVSNRTTGMPLGKPIDKVLKTGETIYLSDDTDLTKKDGSKTPIEDSIAPIIDENGKTTGAIIVFHDISARIQAEMKLKESTNKLKAVLDNSTSVIYIKNLEGRYILVNRNATQMMGKSIEDILGKSDYDLFPLETADQTRANDYRVLASNSSKVFEETVDIGGQKRTFLAVKSHLADSNGDLYGICGISTDITDRKMAETELAKHRNHLEKMVSERTSELSSVVSQLQNEITERQQAEKSLIESEKKFKNIAELLPVGVFETNSKGCLTFVSRKLLDYSGYAIDDILNTISISDMISSHDRRRFLEQIHDILLDGREIRNCEYEVLRKDGSAFIARIHANQIYKDGEVTGIRGVMEDITKYKTQEKQLWRAQKLESVGLLAGGVAHDLNNMLGPLVGYPELILKKLPSDSPIRKQVERIGRSAKDAANVIQDLLALARRGRYQMEPTNLNKVINDYLDSTSFIKISEENPNIIVNTELDNNTHNINGSATHLSKVLMNLIFNSFDAMPDGGSLTIKTKQEHLKRLSGGYSDIKESDYIILSISDTGIGIGGKEKELDKVFEPYYSNKEMGQSGSGLGLAVVYGIVKDHNGYYDIYSKEGEGTEIILYFPITLQDAKKVRSYSTNDLSGHEKILVVDDSQEQREIASDMLGALGYQVEQAENGSKAITYLQKNKVDIVFLDMIMEDGFDGLDTYREMIKLCPGQKTVIVSGYSATERVSEMQSLGAGPFIKKPFSLEEIGMALKQVLQSNKEEVVNAT